MSQLKLETFPREPEITRKLIDWITDTIQPYVSGRVLETNSAEGLMSSRLIENGCLLHLNAISETHRELLRERFKGKPQVRGVHQINFLHPSMEVKYAGFQQKFNAVVALNDAPDLIYDKPSISKAIRFLQIGGTLSIVGRSQTPLYPGTEPDFQYLKRYNQTEISRLLGGCKIMLIRFFYQDGLRFVAVGEKQD